jgi:hypothetical protein
MHRPEGEFSTSTFIAGLCVDANGDMQLAAGSIFELRFADDECPEALRQVRIEDIDATELGSWLSPTTDGG